MKYIYLVKLVCCSQTWRSRPNNCHLLIWPYCWRFRMDPTLLKCMINNGTLYVFDGDCRLIDTQYTCPLTGCRANSSCELYHKHKSNLIIIILLLTQELRVVFYIIFIFYIFLHCLFCLYCLYAVHDVSYICIFFSWLGSKEGLMALTSPRIIKFYLTLSPRPSLLLVIMRTKIIGLLFYIKW